MGLHVIELVAQCINVLDNNYASFCKKNVTVVSKLAFCSVVVHPKKNDIIFTNGTFTNHLQAARTNIPMF